VAGAVATAASLLNNTEPAALDAAGLTSSDRIPVKVSE
jgi:hypothetical protein